MTRKPFSRTLINSIKSGRGKYKQQKRIAVGCVGRLVDVPFSNSLLSLSLSLSRFFISFTCFPVLFAGLVSISPFSPHAYLLCRKWFRDMVLSTYYMLIGFVVHFGFVAVAILLYFLLTLAAHTLTCKLGRFVHCFVIHNNGLVCITRIFALPFTLILCPFLSFFCFVFFQLFLLLFHCKRCVVCVFAPVHLKYFRLLVIYAKFRKFPLSKRCILAFAHF